MVEAKGWLELNLAGQENCRSNPERRRVGDPTSSLHQESSNLNEPEQRRGKDSAVSLNLYLVWPKSRYLRVNP